MWMRYRHAVLHLLLKQGNIPCQGSSNISTSITCLVCITPNMWAVNRHSTRFPLEENSHGETCLQGPFCATSETAVTADDKIWKQIETSMALICGTAVLEMPRGLHYSMTVEVEFLWDFKVFIWHTVCTTARRYSWEEVVVWMYNIYNIYVFNEGDLCHPKYPFMKVNKRLSLVTIWKGDKDSTNLRLMVTIRFPRVPLDAFTSGCWIWDTVREDCSSSKFLWNKFEGSCTKCPK